jgi:DNA repair protein RecO (recombination protein O)
MAQKTEQTAYLLHATPYRETSLIVELFTRENGRISAVAKGAKRRNSAMRAVLLQFQPLAISYFGRQELRNLAGAEWVGGQVAPQGDALICAFYMNELLVRLLPREDPHTALFDGYAQTLAGLTDGAPIDDTLRRFEWLLLREAGYAPDLERDAGNRPIVTGSSYLWQPTAGFVAAEPAAESAVSGSTLHDLFTGRFDSTASRLQAKYLTRTILAHHLDGYPLNTRQILIDLQKL